MSSHFIRKSHTFLLRPAVAWTLVAINVIAGIVGGIYWYGPVLLTTPLWALVFVPDCPLFSFLFAIALIGILAGKRWTWYNALVAMGCVKYGIWTITVWVLFWSAGYPATLESIIMTATHVGLLLEGVFLFTLLKGLRWRHALIAGGWFFLSDYVDYVLGFRPRMAPGVPESTMMWEMLIVSGLLTLVLAWLAERQAASAPVQPPLAQEPKDHQEVAQ